MKLNLAAPTFLVSDVATTSGWYQNHLGFTCSHVPEKPPYVFASMWRDGVEIMLLRLVGYQKPELARLRPEGFWDVYIRMTGVSELYKKLKGLPFVRMHLRRQPYGDTEFEVTDPNGYILVFSERLKNEDN